MVVFAGCRGSASQSDGQDALSVFAASSLREAFADIERAYESAHPELDVRLNFAGSQVLRLQIEQGAPADVFASADQSHMQALVGAGHVTAPAALVDNALALVVPLDNPAGIERFDQLARASRIVIGTDDVPVGIYTRQLFERAGARLGQGFVEAVQGRVVSRESNVRLLRAKVELGEADAALVYDSDAAASRRVRQVPIPQALNVRAHYSIAPLSNSARRVQALRFVDYTRSAVAARIFERHGFLAVQP
ncbi:MAG: molybdate ABC transporter substrate-binding protein [Myxococcales bacterium]|nr:molybdate ABC transporter substrate-binding protein [Myxococcales bacterium]